MYSGGLDALSLGRRAGGPSTTFVGAIVVALVAVAVMVGYATADKDAAATPASTSTSGLTPVTVSGETTALELVTVAVPALARPVQSSRQLATRQPEAAVQQQRQQPQPPAPRRQPTRPPARRFDSSG